MASPPEEKDVSARISNCVLNEEEKAALKEKGYTIESVASEGSLALVYLAVYKGKAVDEEKVVKNVEVKVACKIMETEKTPKDFVNRFLLRELDIISRISHPHIIHLHSILKMNTKLIVAMRYAELGNLCDYIVKYGKIKERQAKIWFRQVCVALHYLHTINISHRDIKCENILITSNYNLKMCDFGYARLAIDGRGTNIESTTFCGSLAYAAPEVIKGSPYSPKPADIWSMGVVLYIMLNGVMPFRTDNIVSLWKTQVEKSYRFRTAIIPRVSKEVIDLVANLLEPNWTLRYTIDKALSSEWFAVDPKMIEFTPMELAALENAKNFKQHYCTKELKKYIIPCKKKIILEEAEEEENIVNTSDETESESIEVEAGQSFKNKLSYDKVFIKLFKKESGVQTD